MCGIAGIVSRKGAARSERLRSAVACLQHRGPDGEGAWSDEQGMVALAHRRLAIIDRSEAAAQPMRRDRLRLVFNGELYNYLELREELIRLGQEFHTQSDTEVVLAAYARWGVACLKHFDGMFALAIWDEEAGQLFLARDRFGEKPLFFSLSEEELLFASEQRALRAMGAPFDVNRSLVYNFLAFGYTDNPADPMETFYTKVSKLPAAHFGLYSPATGALGIHPYWQLELGDNASLSDEEAVGRFRELFSASVSRRLRSDVAVGTSLSGGLDSSSIVAFCARAAAASYAHQCFTAGFEGFEKDEWNYAAEVAQRYGLRHHRVTIADEEVPALMTAVMRAQEEPFSSASVLVQHAVYREARAQGVTVLLDGQGADEVLAGYRKFYRPYWSELYRQRKLTASGELARARSLGVQEAFGWMHKGAALFPDFASGLLEGRKEKRAAGHPDLNPDFAATFRRGSYYSVPLHSGLNGALHFDTAVRGLEELLRLADRNSMARGIEVRLPFLSHELVSFLFTLPSRFKIREGWTKWLLRTAVSDALPEGIVWRRDKIGFEPPQKHWMQLPPVAALIREGKERLVHEKILEPSVLKKHQPHEAYAAEGRDWKYWSVAGLFSA